VKAKTKAAALSINELCARRAFLLSRLALDLLSCTSDKSVTPGLRLLSVELDKLADDILTISPSAGCLFRAN
jgi:hypothetical protein